MITAKRVLRGTGGRRGLATAFAGFALLSGIGWCLDFLAFTVLVKLAGLSPFAANLLSSYVGITFVWFASLRVLFDRAGHAGFLVAYWGYQLASILAYSQLLEAVAAGLAREAGWLAAAGGAALAAKIVVTPFNLLTNFVFMKLLTRAMPRPAHHGS